MRFISGLKGLFKQHLLAIILILFIISWILVLLGTTIITNPYYLFFILIFGGILTGFIFVLMIISIFRPIKKMGPITITIALLLTIPFLIIFNGFITIFYFFSFFVNLFLIALFAYKWCMDNSINLDNYLYENKSTRKITRTIEFVGFLIISFFFLYGTIILFREILVFPLVANIFLFITFIDLSLLLFVLLRVLLVQKISAYISLFYLLSYFYTLYVIIDLSSTFIFGSSGSTTFGYKFISFAIDLVMFIYIMGAIFNRVDYLKEKLRIFRGDTIALFVILMKIIAKIAEIVIQLNPSSFLGFNVFQAIIVLIYFTFFALIFGLYSIIFHKEGKK